MENQQQGQGTEIFGLQFDESSKASIKAMASWAMIIVISSVIGYVVSIVQYIKTSRQVNRLYDDYGSFGTVRSAAGGVGIVQLTISILVGLLLCYFLYQFSAKAKNGIDTANQSDLNSGLGYLRNYFLTSGILAIIAIVLIMLLILFLGAFIGN